MAKLKFLFSACLFIFLAAAKEYRQTLNLGKGIPVPHAAFIEGAIKRAMFPNKTDDQTFLELYGDVSDLDNATLARLQSLEFSVLDVDNVKLYAKLARRCMERAQALGAGPAGGRRLQYSSFDRYDGHIMNAVMSLMQQSTYSTRLMLQQTNPIRARFRSDISFNMGQLYGTLMELKLKATRAFNTIYHLLRDYEIKMAWYLLLYERVLQIHTDVTTTVHRLFELNHGGVKTLINENPAGDAYKAEEKKKLKKASGSKSK